MLDGTLNPWFQPKNSPVADEKAHIVEMMRKRDPYAPPVFVSKGTVETTLGGITTFKDVNGGTLLTYDPDTGTITIYGGIVSQQVVQVGTLNNSTLSGTNTNLGLLNGGTYSGQHTGTITGRTTGTVDSSYISNGTINAPTITGLPQFDTYSGSFTLTSNGQFAIQAFGSAGNLFFRFGGTTFRVAVDGTI